MDDVAEQENESLELQLTRESGLTDIVDCDLLSFSDGLECFE